MSKLIIYKAILSGLTISLRGESFQTGDHVLITDINPDGDNNEDALICTSERNTSSGGDWYLHPTVKSTDSDDRIVSPGDNNGEIDRGWNRNGDFDSSNRRLVRLRRITATAEEGVFTCRIPGDMNKPNYVGIYYPCESLSDGG